MATVSFANDIQPIFAQFVAQMRWRFDLTRYEDVRENSAMIYAFISSSDPDGRMPPPPFEPLTDAQVSQFKTWMDTGYPR